MADQQDHPIFTDIWRGDLEAVQQRVLAEAAVLEERADEERSTPLMWATQCEQEAIALWIIRHRGQHDLDSADEDGWTAMHWASYLGLLELVQALVVAGADAAAVDGEGETPLIQASRWGRTDIVAFLLQQPAVKASVDHISILQETALSCTSFYGHQPIVELLLDAGADPTIPAGPTSPLNSALRKNHHAIAALLRHVIAMADRARALHKARCLLGAGAASLACLQGRVEQGQAPPQVELITFERHRQALQHLQQPQLQQALQDLYEHEVLLQLRQLLQRRQGNDNAGQEKVRATAAFAVGVSGGEKDTGLCGDLYLKLLGYMLPVWADKGPEA